MSIGQRVRDARELLEPKLSTKELDKLAGLAPGHTWSIEESGGDKAEFPTLNKIARVFGITLDWLARGTGDGPSAERAAAFVNEARKIRKSGAIGERDPLPDPDEAPASERNPLPGKEGKAS